MDGDVGAGRVRAHVWVTGRVQGVSFRAYTAREALAAGLSGWVRNLDDGRVEAAFEGAEADVRSLVDWCGRGSPGARVDGVEVAWEDARHEQGFVVRR
jgi:acylphosphatase